MNDPQSLTRWLEEHWALGPFLPAIWIGLKWGFGLVERVHLHRHQDDNDAREVVTMALAEYKSLVQEHKDGRLEAEGKLAATESKLEKTQKELAGAQDELRQTIAKQAATEAELARTQCDLEAARVLIDTLERRLSELEKTVAMLLAHRPHPPEIPHG